MSRSPDDVSKLKFHVFRDERFVDLNLYQFGWERTTPAHSYGPHARNHYLFHYIIAGKGVLLANEQEYFHYGGTTASWSYPARSPPIAPTKAIPGNIPGWSLTACVPMKA